MTAAHQIKFLFLWKMRNESIINLVKQFDQVSFVCSTIFVNDVSLIIGISQSALLKINFLLLAAWCHKFQLKQQNSNKWLDCKSWCQNGTGHINSCLMCRWCAQLKLFSKSTKKVIECCGHIAMRWSCKVIYQNL